MMLHILMPIRVRLTYLLLLTTTLGAGEAQEKLSVAFIYPQTPTSSTVNTYDYAIAGEAGRRGAELAYERFAWVAQQQGVDFRVLMNSAPSPSSAVRAAQRLIQNDRVYAIVGGFDAPQAKALAKVAAERNVLFFNVGATDHTTIPTTHTFHLQPSAATYLRAISSLASTTDPDKWLVLHAADEEGENRLEAAKDILFEGVSPLTVSISSDAPVFHEAFSTIRELAPEKVLLLLDWRLQLDFLTQFESMQLELPTIWALPDSVTTSREFYGLLRSGAPNAGRGPHMTIWDPTLDGTEAGFLNELFESRFGEPMDPAAWATFEAIRLAFEAAMGSETTDAERIKDYLLHANRQLYVDKDSPTSFDADTHELKQNLYLTQLVDRARDGSRLDKLKSRAMVLRLMPVDQVW